MEARCLIFLACFIGVRCAFGYPLLMHDPAPAGVPVLYQTHFGWVIVNMPDGGGGKAPDIQCAEMRFIAFESNRFLPQFTPVNYFRNAYQWNVWNTGQTMQLITNGVVVGTVPAVPGMDMNMLEAWRWQNQASNVTIGIIDVGVNAHRDLTTVLPGVSIGSSAETFTHGQSDSFGHGTFIAGLAAAWPFSSLVGPVPAGPTNLSLLGVAPFARILPAKVDLLGLPGLIAGIDWAITSGAKVLNFSWGWGYDADGLRDACLGAGTNGCIVVQAAPNSPRSIDQFPDYPGSYGLSNVIAVTAMNPEGLVYTNAAYGSQLVAAPGVSLVGLSRDGTNYSYGNGSSFAAPLVCGVLALLMAEHPTWTYQQVVKRLRSTLDPCPGCQGRVNAGRALRNNPAILPAFQPVAMGGGGLTVPSGPIPIETSEDLISWKFWDIVAGPVLLPIDQDKPMQFFRVKP